MNDDSVVSDSRLSLTCIKSNPYFPHALLICVQLCFSGWHIVGSICLKDGANPLIFALYREVFASMLMYFTLVQVTGNYSILISKTDYSRFIFLGTCSFINVVGTIVALEFISATRYAIFQPTIPVIASLIAILVGVEKFAIAKGAGVILAIFGAVLSETWKLHPNDSDSSNESNIQLGTILTVIQCTGMACIIVFQRPLLQKYNSCVITFIYYTFGCFITLIVCLSFSFEYSAKEYNFNGRTLPWIGLVYASIFATLFTYNSYTFVGKHLLPSTITVYSTFQPIGTVILSFLILGQIVTIPECIGGIIVILGLLCTVYSSMRTDNTVPSSPLSENVTENDSKLLYHMINSECQTPIALTDGDVI